MNITKVTYGGKYFYAHDEELEALFGQKNLNGDTIEVVKTSWSDWFRDITQDGWKIMAWTPRPSHGRKDPKGDAAAGDWSVGDLIMSKECYEGTFLVYAFVKYFFGCLSRKISI